MLTYSYTALFLYPFFAGYYTNITVNSCNTKRISNLEKSLSEKYVHIPGCQKNGAIHIGIQKNRAIHILFVEKRGPIIYLAALKKGAIRHAHPYYAIYRKLPSPSPLPPRTVSSCTSGIDSISKVLCLGIEITEINTKAIHRKAGFPGSRFDSRFRFITFGNQNYRT